MSNKPAPRCPGCGKEMRLRQYNCDRGAVNAWYACDCGWSAPIGNDESIAYDKAMKRYAENPWISVKDRLPEHENEYLVCLDDGFIATTAWIGGDWELWADAGDVTNWREPPPPPKEGE